MGRILGAYGTMCEKMFKKIIGRAALKLEELSIALVEVKSNINCWLLA